MPKPPRLRFCRFDDGRSGVEDAAAAMHACIAASDRQLVQASAADGGGGGGGRSSGGGGAGCQPQQTMARLLLDEGQASFFQ